jgi:hypothetical protein
VLEHLEPVRARHADVQQHQVGALVVEDLERPIAVLGLQHLVAGARQVLPQGPADQLLVVDDQDAFRHGEMGSLRERWGRLRPGPPGAPAAQRR